VTLRACGNVPSGPGRISRQRLASGWSNVLPMRLLLAGAAGLLLAGCGGSSGSSAALLEYVAVMNTDQLNVVMELNKYADCIGVPTAACSTEAAALQTDLSNQVADIDRRANPTCLRDVVPRLRKALRDEMDVLAKVQAASLAHDDAGITSTFPALDQGKAEFTAAKAAMDKAAC
jgi:hypothetical protein